LTDIPLQRYSVVMKEYLRERHCSIYSISKKCGIPYSTLNDLVNGKVPIDQCRIGLLRKLSDALGLSMDEVYGLCARKPVVAHTAYDIDVRIIIKNKTYFALFEYEAQPVELPLCRVCDDAGYYIEEIARWRTEAYIQERRMESFGKGTGEWNTI